MSKTLYFGNLPWAVTEEDLTESVGQYCQVIAARVATDGATGRSRGFGFVEVPEESAQDVIDRLNGAEWEGRNITVNEARPKRNDGDGPRRRQYR